MSGVRVFVTICILLAVLGIVMALVLLIGKGKPTVRVVAAEEVTSAKTVVVIERLPWIDGYVRGCVLEDKLTGRRYLMVLNGDRGGIAVVPLEKVGEK